MKKELVFCVDFDGTCVFSCFPDVGEDVAGAVSVMKELVAAGYRLILWTCRSDEYLDAAIEWFEERGIPLFGVNENPEQAAWSRSPKAYCNKLIDDCAIGVPLKFLDGGGFVVDWAGVRKILVDKKILK